MSKLVCCWENDELYDTKTSTIDLHYLGEFEQQDQKTTTTSCHQLPHRSSEGSRSTRVSG